MPEPEARTEDIRAGLAAVGLNPAVKEYRDHTRIEAALPAAFPTEAWGEVLALLATADWFGLADSGARGRSLWAAVTKNTPTSPDAT
ncbi:hypothetical protein [Streptomyces sp. NPDC008139]|uniref:hypothetical protein n=1 Tax=Streptomyces sp. NPDC008139 TaxID=3364814 RepID=UPI0036F1763A